MQVKKLARHHYRVQASDTLRVERLPAEVGARITIQPVLAVSMAQL